MAQTCALIAPVQPILHRVPCSNETLPNAPKHYEMLQNMSLAPMGWIECVLCEKFRCDFMAQTCALIALVQPVVHRVSCTNETLTNPTKHYETHEYMSLASNGGGSGVFIAKTFDATLRDELLLQFGLYCTEFCKATKRFQIHPNSTKCAKT